MIEPSLPSDLTTLATALGQVHKRAHLSVATAGRVHQRSHLPMTTAAGQALQGAHLSVATPNQVYAPKPPAS